MLPDVCVTFMSVLFRPAHNFVGQVIENVSEGKYITVNNSTSGEVTFKKCLKLGITYFHLKITTSHNHLTLVSTTAEWDRVSICSLVFYTRSVTH